MTAPTVLVIGKDAASLADELADSLADCETVPCSSFDAAQKTLEAEDITFVVTRYALPDGDVNGFDVFTYVQKRFTDVPVVVFTSKDLSEDENQQPQHVLQYDADREAGALRQLAVMIESAADIDVPTLYPMPVDEEDRLDAVATYDVSGMDAEHSFERMTHIVKTVFDVDMAFLGIVDQDEERYLSCQGFDADSLPREHTICTFTILEDTVMMVEDVAADDRFKDNDKLEELNVRWYAGAPLVTPDGQRIGTLCALDSEPHEFDEDEETLLQQFADELMEQIVLRKRVNDLEQALEQGRVDGEVVATTE